jgi:tyrosinase
MFQALSYLLLLILSSSLQAYVQAQGPPPGVALAVDSPTASEDICGPRIRKSWDMLTPVEKDIYLRAIGRAMDDGIYNKFIEIHTERLTSAEAHRTCMFIYWHRLFLLGFENMLRSYGGEFACITLPYWDYVTQNVGFLNGECSSMEACSPIMQEMGGSTSGTRRSVTINGTPVSNNICVNNPPLNHFCENANRQQCAQCVPRGTWSRAAFPPTASISSIMRQLFSATTIQEVANNIETGIHSESSLLYF